MGNYPHEIVGNQKTKIIEKHNEALTEQQKVNKYSEGVCMLCFTKTFVVPVVIKVCKECLFKFGREAYLAVWGNSIYGLCFACGKYKFNVGMLNGRVCKRCNEIIAKVEEEYKKAGGSFGHDPFWKKVKNHYGKDWQILYSGMDERLIKRV